MLAAVSLVGIEKIATFIVMLSVLVVLHEYGHFLVARRNGVRVNEFAVGFGPKLVAWRSPRSGTLYTLRILPIGGFCAMEGEDARSSEAEQQREFRARKEYAPSNFQAKSPWQRLSIVLAGPIANFVLCYAILLVSALAFGAPTDKAQPIVGEVLESSPAASAGIRPGDRIVEIDGVAVTTGRGLVDTIHRSLGKRLRLAYLRNGERNDVSVTPTTCPAPMSKSFGCIGFAPVPAFERIGIGMAVQESAAQFSSIASQTVEGVILIATQFSKYAPQVAGPIGMGQMATTVQDWGWGPYFALAATISFALGLFNLLPLPALDGGRAAFIVAELLRGKPIDPEKEAMVHLAGFAALMALIVVVAFHDVVRIVTGQGVM